MKLKFKHCGYATNSVAFVLSMNCPLPQKECAICQGKATDETLDVIKEDVAGAIVGAAGAWVANGVPAAGQVAYGSAIVGAGVGASVDAAVDQFLEWAGW